MARSLPLGRSDNTGNKRLTKNETTKVCRTYAHKVRDRRDDKLVDPISKLSRLALRGES